MGWPEWTPAVRCTSGPQPGVMAFAAWCAEEYGDKGYYNLGIYNCRTVRGGRTTSMHGEGRALDAGFPVGDPDGDDLLKRIIRRPGRLGVQAVIYERRIYSALSPAGRYYGGVAPHYDHLHIEFTWEAAQNLTLATVRRVMSRKVFKPGSRDLHLGKQGADVEWVQRSLGLKADGIFGPITKEAVRQLELRAQAKYPRMKADGYVGKITWRALGIVPKY